MMRALTLTNPWAGLVASGIKLVENRQRPMIAKAHFGSPFAIHASREIDESVYHRIAELAPELAADFAIVPGSAAATPARSRRRPRVGRSFCRRPESPAEDQMIETQSSICTWEDATFGVPVSDASIAARALVEMAELVTAVVNGEPAERIGAEIADVVLVLARLGRILGVDAVALASGPCRSRWQAGEPICHAARAAARLGMALESLTGEVSLAATDLRDTASELIWLSTALAIDIPSAIDAKMAVNRARKWVRDGNGHGRHVEEEGK